MSRSRVVGGGRAQVARMIAAVLSVLMVASVLSAAPAAAADGFACVVSKSGGDAHLVLSGNLGSSQNVLADGKWQINLKGRSTYTAKGKAKADFVIRLRGGAYENNAKGYTDIACATASGAAAATPAPAPAPTAGNFSCVVSKSGGDADLVLSGNLGSSQNVLADGKWQINLKGRSTYTAKGKANADFVIRLRGGAYENNAKGYTDIACTTNSAAAPTTTAPAPAPAPTTTVAPAPTGQFKGSWNNSGSVRSPNGVCRFVLQTDGNLVIYGKNNSVEWSSWTHGSGADRLVMQGDGNLVLYKGNTVKWATYTHGNNGATAFLTNDCVLRVTKNNKTLWSSDPNIAAPAPTPTTVPAPAPTPAPVQVDDRLETGERLNIGDRLESANGNCSLRFQSDRQIALYRKDQTAALFHTGTWNSDAAFMEMQSDGNLVVYKTGGVEDLWSSDTQGSNAEALLGNDCVLRVKTSTGTLLWDSTNGKPTPPPATATPAPAAPTPAGSEPNEAAETPETLPFGCEPEPAIEAALSDSRQFTVWSNSNTRFFDKPTTCAETETPTTRTSFNVIGYTSNFYRTEKYGYVLKSEVSRDHPKTCEEAQFEVPMNALQISGTVRGCYDGQRVYSTDLQFFGDPQANVSNWLLGTRETDSLSISLNGVGNAGEWVSVIARWETKACVPTPVGSACTVDGSVRVNVMLFADGTWAFNGASHGPNGFGDSGGDLPPTHIRTLSRSLPG